MTGVIGLIILTILFPLFQWMWKYYQEMSYWKEVKKPVIIISNHPVTNEKVKVPGIEVINCAYTECKKEEQRVIQLLTESRNPLFNDDQLSKDKKITVNIILFNDAGNEGEDWGEEFVPRARQEAKEIVRKHTKKIKNKDQDFFFRQLGDQAAWVNDKYN